VERAVAGSPDDRLDPEVHLVDKAPAGQLVGEPAAAEREQVAAVLALQRGHGFGQVPLEQRRVPGERPLQRLGGDVLGDAVRPLGETGVVGGGGPEAGQARVDLAAEQERVRGE
jgi:hypothetical protein